MLDLAEQGAGQYGLGQYEAALQTFTRAYSYLPDSALLRNIGRCHDQLGHVEPALEFYQKYLDTSPAPSAAQSVREYMARLQAQLAKMGTLVLSGGPPDTRVTLDGALIGKTPIAPLRLAPGPHTLLLAPLRRPAADHTIQVGEAQRVVVNLDTLFPPDTHAKLAIVGGQPGDVLRIDGKDVGAIPTESIQLFAGTHQVIVVRAEHHDFRGEVVLEPGEEHTLTLAFVKVDRGGPGPWPWITGGIGLAAAATGVGFTVMAESEYDEYLSTRDEAARLNAKRNDAVAYSLYGVGGALIITAVVLYFVLQPDDDDSQAGLPFPLPVPTVTPARGGAVMGLSATF